VRSRIDADFGSPSALGASHGWARSVSATLSGYLDNRSKLMDQLIYTNINQVWNGHDKAVREIREDIKTIDDRVAEIVRQMLMPNDKSEPRAQPEKL